MTSQANEGAEKAVSVAISLGSEKGHPIRTANGRYASDGAILGLTTTLSFGPVVFGGIAETSSLVDGIDAQTLGGIAGIRLPASPQFRVLLLAEGGRRTFADALELFFDLHAATPRELSFPYAGGRAGIHWLVSEHFDLGAIAFARTDFGQGTMVVRKDGYLGSIPSETTYQVGGFSGGIAFQVGLRFDAGRPAQTPY